MTFTVACAQIAPAKAEVEANLDRIAEVVLQASSQGADLVLFPESVVSGYFLEGGVYESAITAQELVAGLESRLSSLTRPLDIALGFYEHDEASLYNSAAYIEFTPYRGRPAGPDAGETPAVRVHLRHVYRKFFLPTYGVFDEERFVSRGRDLGVFESRFGTLALLICEDVWHSILPTLCAVGGAQILLVPSASPARGFSGERPENLQRYERLLAGIAEEHGVFCVNSQLCGFEGGKGFTGGSMVFDPSGAKLVQAPICEEHLILATIDTDLVALARSQSPLLSDLESAWADIVRIVSE
ncbi:MAG: hypothetical protein K1X67_14925 [Fimbriimonadaceae bacterium]|nr:hypothetical protein [Fimbriimonadaceae bacterium]